MQSSISMSTSRIQQLLHINYMKLLHTIVRFIENYPRTDRFLVGRLPHHVALIYTKFNEWACACVRVCVCVFFPAGDLAYRSGERPNRAWSFSAQLRSHRMLCSLLWFCVNRAQALLDGVLSPRYFWPQIKTIVSLHKDNGCYQAREWVCWWGHIQNLTRQGS